MGARDSVCQNRYARNMSCWRQYRIRRIEYSSSFNTSIPMKLDQKREKDQRTGPVYSSLSLVESLTFSLYYMRDQFGISWKPSDYSKCKRSILRVHHMKLHGKLNASVFFTRDRHIFKRIVKKSASCNEVIKIVGLRINWCRELL